MSGHLVKIHEEAMIEFDEIQASSKDERGQCLEDRRFYSITGAQWEGTLGAQFENKPKLEFNKVHLAVMKIISDHRNNAMSVNFISKDGSPNSQMADTCNALYRACEQDSVASEAYDNAFEEAVGGGFGALRLITEYEDEGDEENEAQKIRIVPIFDADSSVYFDLNAKRQDKSDAQSCYVLTAMSRRAYENEYGDDAASISKNIGEWEFDWNTPDVVNVAEYYKVEKVKEKRLTFRGLDGTEKVFFDSDFEHDDDLLKDLRDTGYKKIKERTITKKAVHKYIIDGSRVLEDCGLIAGESIPVIPVYGKRWYVDNVERMMGHVRLAKDPQRLKNMQVSQLAIHSATSQTEKPIFTAEQIIGHEIRWSEDNLKNFPFLLVNPITDVNGNMVPSGPVGYTKPSMIAPALAALLQITDVDIKEILGGGQNQEEIMANISGVAIDQIHQRQDMQSFIYLSNMAKAIQRCGEVWLSMAKEIYVEPGRRLKALNLHNEVESVELHRQVVDKKSGVLETENDFSSANFDVAVTVGPSSASRKQSTVRTIMTMIPLVKDPELVQALTLLAAMNMEGEGLSEFRDYLRRRSVAMGIVKPTEEEAKEMAEAQANQKPDPNAAFLQAEAAKATAIAKKTEADTIKSLADTEKIKAETIAIGAGIDQEDRRMALDMAETLQNRITLHTDAQNKQGNRPALTGETL
jgi:hypothetical protein